MIRPAHKDRFLVRVLRPEKLGSLFMAAYKFNMLHNIAKHFRFQICEVVDTNNIDYEGIKVGDQVVITRWSALEVGQEDLSVLPVSRILAKVEQ